MFAILFGGIFTILVAYIIFTLITSSGSDLPDNSFDAFIDHSESSGSNAGSVNNSKQAASKSYKQIYSVPGKQILIVYGTEYGCSEELAREMFDRILLQQNANSGDFEWQPRIINAKNFELVNLMLESILLVIISTAGDGVPPTDAREFVKSLLSSTADLFHLSFSVLALGDSNYIYYCRGGKTVDTRLGELNAKRVVDRADVDCEDRGIIIDWQDKVLRSLDLVEVPPRLDYLKPVDNDCDSSSGYSRDQPYMATLKIKYNLTNEVGENDKDTIHCEFSIADSAITWTVGDALGIYPRNSITDVDILLKALDLTGSEAVDAPKWAYQPQSDKRLSLKEVLVSFYDLKHIKPEFLELLLRNSSEDLSREHLSALLKNGLFKSNVKLHEYLYEREVVDVIEQYSSVVSQISIDEVLKHLRPLLPRYYSMSSSCVADPTTVCVTAAVVRYETLGRSRSGVTTTYLQDRLRVGDSCPVFISRNPDFRLPTDSSLPIIMIGPGTGIAPFRAFIQERIYNKASGRNVLYFGCRSEHQDFLYKEELGLLVNEGHLELRTAFSRDQPEKIYVQDLLRKDCSAIWQLIEVGAHIYVCGDARYMAHDVHCALLDIVATRGELTDGKSSERDAVGTVNGLLSVTNPEQFLVNLEEIGRYQKDCWIT